MKITVAMAQAIPAVLNREAAVEKACAWILEAGRRGAAILAFPETWLPVYPFWCDAGTFSAWGHEGAKRLQARLARESVVVPSTDTDRIAHAAGEANCAVVLGVNERGPSGTLYNTMLVFSELGELVGHHRKLVPTFGERLVWGHGDAAGLRTYEVAEVKLGGLICWENWMPLPRQVLHAEGEQVHVALWPHVKELHQLATRHYAFEGRTYVLAPGMFLPKSAIPQDFELAPDLAALPDPILPGGSCIAGPDGSWVVEPQFDREDLVTAELDLSRLDEERLVLDTGGHYSRPDLFQLGVNRERLALVRETASDR